MMASACYYTIMHVSATLYRSYSSGIWQRALSLGPHVCSPDASPECVHLVVQAACTSCKQADCTVHELMEDSPVTTKLCYDSLSH